MGKLGKWRKWSGVLERVEKAEGEYRCMLQIQFLHPYSQHAGFLRPTRGKPFSTAVIAMDSDKVEEVFHHEQVFDQARNYIEKPVYRDAHGLPLNPQPSAFKDDPLVRSHKPIPPSNPSFYFSLCPVQTDSK